MEIKQHFIKISSKLDFPKEIGLGQDVVATIAGQNFILNCIKVETIDNQDGTKNQVYILKYFGE